MATYKTQKQPAFGSQAMIAANHPAASAAGATMFALGGNVADAAVAAIFTSAVVEPQMVSPLGGGYIIHREADGAVTVIDNYAEGPGLAREDMYQLTTSGSVLDDLNVTGHLASGIPGCVKGWFELHRLKGQLPIRQVMAPAIQCAEDGFPVSRYLKQAYDQTATELRKFPDTARVFLPGGAAPEVGQMLRNPELADSLRGLAAQGPDLLYKGRIGDALVEEMNRGGGLITKDDLAQYEIRRPEPIRGTYREYEIIGTPPTSGGGLLNQLGFNILENFDLRSLGFGTAKYWHLVIETLKLMFADRNRYLGDPKFVEFPLEELLSKEYGRQRAGLIDAKSAQQYEAGEPVSAGSQGHTTHLTVMATDGSTVTMTQTINLSFGSRVVVPGTGLLLNNNMALFDPRPRRPNSPGPYKRMLTATAASIIEKDGRPVFALGTPGGIQIFPSVLQAILNVVDHEMNLQEAVEAPRLWSNGPTTLIESAADGRVVAELESMGHRIQQVPTIANCMNGVQVDARTGMLLGAACWRGDGSPVGVSGGNALSGGKWQKA